MKFLNQEEYIILHDLRIKDYAGYFQIDTLVMSPKFLLIVEIKNWYGKVIFGSKGQVTRVGDGGKEEGFNNPVFQAKLQRHRLNLLLHSQGEKKLPIEFHVVIALPSTIIKSESPDSIPKQVIYNNELLFAIHNLETQYTNSVITVPDLECLANRLISSHDSSARNILDSFNISKESVIKGVICPVCDHSPMVRKKHKWHCVQCMHYSKDAHLEALSDYKLLFNRYITNSQARDFLKVDSPYVVKRLLQQGGFRSVGNTSNRYYIL